MDQVDSSGNDRKWSDWYKSQRQKELLAVQVWRGNVREKEELRMTQTRKRGSSVAQMVKNLPAMQETWVQSLHREDPLEKEMAPHSRILVWRIPWTEKPGGLQSMGSQRIGTTEKLSTAQ